LWQDETSKDYPTRRLLTSLKVPFEENKNGNPEKVFYRIMQTAILLYQHARGVPLASLAVKFKTPLGELENNLKFSILWLLSCLFQICNSKRCYKLDFLMMKSLKLIECTSVGSELGVLLTIKGVGKNTVYNLIKNGLNSMDDLASVTLSDLVGRGIRERQAGLILKWAKRGLR
jgi:hypothetical protein